MGNDGDDAHGGDKGTADVRASTTRR